jgi:gamma-glutamyltranspeptidase/glutathione hydrolase
LIKQPGKRPVAIMGSGPAARAVNRDDYDGNGKAINPRGGPAALTVAGAVSGWQKALDLSRGDGKIPMSELLADAIQYARTGTVVTESLSTTLAEKWPELTKVPGFAPYYRRRQDQGLIEEVFQPGDTCVQTALSDTLEELARRGLDTFYRGEVAESIAKELTAAGSPITIHDLNSFDASIVTPLTIQTKVARFWNTPAPTQGIISLGLLGLFDRLYHSALAVDSSEYLHRIVECTKRLFSLRDTHLTDPRYMSLKSDVWLEQAFLEEMAESISAVPQEHASREVGGDTVYLAAIDKEGTVVSYIQSIYWEFGSGVILPQTGVLWQNRGVSFSLDPQSSNVLRPGAFPRHTLNPALAETTDGSIMAYGTMGGDGQPQTQTAIATRIFWYHHSLQSAITAPRWLYGRTWGNLSSTLKIEEGYSDHVISELVQSGHQIEVLPRFSSIFGHASAIRLYPNGSLEGASDPRSDGAAISVDRSKRAVKYA